MAAAGALGFGALVARARPGRMPALRLLLLTLALGVAATAAFIPVAVSAIDGPAEEFAIRAEGHLQIIDAGMQVLMRAPLTGAGINSFPFVAHCEGLTSGIRLAGLTHAHSFLPQLALDIGLLGGLAFVSLVVVAMSRLDLRSGSAGPDRVCLAAGVALCSIFLFGLWDSISLGGKPGLIIWVLLAVVAGAPKITTHRGPSRATGHGAIRAAFAIVLVVGVAAAVAVGDANVVEARRHLVGTDCWNEIKAESRVASYGPAPLWIGSRVVAAIPQDPMTTGK